MVSGLTTDSPQLNVNYDSIGVVLEIGDSANYQLVISNEGKYPLSFEVQNFYRKSKSFTAQQSQDLPRGLKDETISILNRKGTSTHANMKASAVFFDDFESGQGDWSVEVYGQDDLWNITNKNYSSSSNSWYCGIPSAMNYNTNRRINTAVISPLIDLASVPSDSLFLSFRESFQTEKGWDYCMVDISADGGRSWIPLRGTATYNTAPSGNSNGWVTSVIDITEFVGKPIQLRFYFDTKDHLMQDYPGWFFDDVIVYTGVPKWLSLSELSGLIPPDSSMTIEISVETKDLLGGDYRDSIVLVTNDPDNLSVEIPAFLELHGIPEINTSDTLLSYGSSFEGLEVSRQLIISNTGNDVLQIDSLVISNPNFVSNLFSFEVGPGDQESIEIIFSPDKTGQEFGILWIYSDDPDDDKLMIELEGKGTQPPKFGPITTFSSHEIFSGDSLVFTIPITNGTTGTGPDLSYKVKIHQGKKEEPVPLMDFSVVPEVNENVPYDRNRVLVKKSHALTSETSASLYAELNVKVLSRFQNSDLELWQLSGTSVTEFIQMHYQDERIEYIEPDYEWTVVGSPDDPDFKALWAMNNTGQNEGLVDADIDAPEAWNLQTDCEHVIIGVIDTGIDYNHEDLSDNIWRNEDEVPNNGIDDDNNGYIDDYLGWDFYGNDNDPLDGHGHGTHVAGTIGAVGNNNLGVTGVCWKAQLMALKFLGDGGSGSTSGAIGALEYAVANGVSITNNSWGGGAFSLALRDAIQAAQEAGQLFVASAGNNSTNNDNFPHYPSSYANEAIVSVASTDHKDDFSYFSSFGKSSVDLGAPGSGIWSTTPGDAYTSYNGTSMAAPHVSGALALGWAKVS